MATTKTLTQKQRKANRMRGDDRQTKSFNASKT